MELLSASEARAGLVDAAPDDAAIGATGPGAWAAAVSVAPAHPARARTPTLAMAMTNGDLFMLSSRKWLLLRRTVSSSQTVAFHFGFRGRSLASIPACTVPHCSN